MKSTTASHPHRRGFTLVELLVVIGIIALLISILLPVLGNARKAGYRVKCLSNLRQLGDAYKLYQLETKGWWPPAWQQYLRKVPPGPVNVTSDKRWHDFVGKYVFGKQEINWNGTQLKSLEPQIWSEPMWHSENPIWGCPVWDRVGRDFAGNVTSVDDPNAQYFTGYLQNKYPFAPKATPIAESLTAANPVPGGFFKYTQWSRQSERCLIFESISHNWSPGSLTWPFKPENAGGAAFPTVPDRGFGLDFNRHGKYKTGNKYNDASMNILYCDGHAGFVSCREAWRAIRFD